MIKQMTERRKSPVHLNPSELGNRVILILVTCCSKNRKRIFARGDVHALMRLSWQNAAGWVVGRYCILPDHVHFFATPSRFDPPPLKDWVRYWKSLVSQKWPRRMEESVWQNDFWDRQLRRSESYNAKWEYVRLNPVRHGLVEHAEDWPYQGELNVLEWHDQ
jgi:putative transposase